MAVYTNPSIDQQDTPKQLFYVDQKCAIFTCNGSPEGVILANTGSIALSDNGLVYKKTTDNVNTGWLELITTTGQILNIPRNLESNVTPVGNVGAGLDTLHSFTLPANSLITNGSYLTVRYAGTFATNDNDKRIQVSFGGQVFLNTGPFDQDVGQWCYDIEYARLNATTIVASANFLWGNLTRDGAGAFIGNGIFQSTVVNLTVADLIANTMLMIVEAVGVADNDIVQTRSKIELIQK